MIRSKSIFMKFMMLAFFGLACHECPALLATKTNDDEKRAVVARAWSKLFKADIKPEMINDC